jgi:hypothetical protein
MVTIASTVNILYVKPYLTPKIRTQLKFQLLKTGPKQIAFTASGVRSCNLGITQLYIDA